MASGDPYSVYEAGIQRLLEHLGTEHPRYSEALTYQQRLAENLGLTRQYGDTETRRAERAQVVGLINALALEIGGPTLVMESKTRDGAPGDTGREELNTWLYQNLSIPLAPTEREQLSEALLQGLTVAKLHWNGFNSLEELVDAMTSCAGDTPEIQALHDSLDKFLPQPAPRTTVAHLRQILEPIPFSVEDLENLFYTSRPPGATWVFPNMGHRRDTLARIIHILAQTHLPPNATTYPLLDFGYQVLHKYPHLDDVQRVKEKLVNWLEQTQRILGLETLNDPRQGTTVVETVLIVQIEPPPTQALTDLSKLNSITWHVQACMVNRYTNNSLRIEPVQEKIGCTLEEMSSLFVDMFRKNRGQMAPDPTVEFVLPLELLLYDFDNWKVPNETGRRWMPIGRHHCVVVRSLDRIVKQFRDQLSHQWSKKWNYCRNIKQPVSPDDVHWVTCKDDCEPDLLDVSLRRDSIAVLAQPYLPSDEEFVDETLIDMLDVVIASGVAIALFVRRDAVDHTLKQQEVETILQTSPLDRLSTSVREHRRDAVKAKDNTHPGHHLTLLWDDHSRPSPLETTYNLP